MIKEKMKMFDQNPVKGVMVGFACVALLVSMASGKPPCCSPNADVDPKPGGKSPLAIQPTCKGTQCSGFTETMPPHNGCKAAEPGAGPLSCYGTWIDEKHSTATMQKPDPKSCKNGICLVKNVPAGYYETAVPKP
jgi:hypothetical protein